MSSYARLSRYAHRATWAAWWLLLLQQTLDAALHGAPWIIWFVKLLPLLMFVPGMRKNNLRSYIWLSFVCLGYFYVLVPRIFAEPGSYLVIVGLVAVVILFTSAMFFVRWRARSLREQDAQKVQV